MARHPTQKPATPIETLKHKDKRANIPTEELRALRAEIEAAGWRVTDTADGSVVEKGI